ncbi:hypothetical protein A2881_02115 [Candidatus Peribacteria bacterium RIFCSPHIGHO2_01_FULL_55_13]|nr:MAG: hypothetical protein A2881_02115 [Candidatus Peribacteria bacterium RIFCSPHIGHO2_01_FULL_55_13]OGJ65319.1 MAG: hypothetical protein A3F36_02100 [Candidatus Peribacteria bacterium RIFCSPHIGHO2_12_FULL_55_11]
MHLSVVYCIQRKIRGKFTKMERIPSIAVTLVAYLAGVATILVLQAIQPETRVVVVPGAANILARPPVTADQETLQPSQPTQPSAPQTVPTVTTTGCTQEDDCNSPTAICAIRYGVCQEMHNPSCSCSQPQVLRCTDVANHLKHTFCPGGCEPTEGGARCL